MWHVSARSGVATLRTAIHLLLTYGDPRIRILTSTLPSLNPNPKNPTLLTP